MFSKPPHTQFCASNSSRSVLSLGGPLPTSGAGRQAPWHWPSALRSSLQILFQPHARAQEYSQNEEADPSRSKRRLLVWLSSTRTLSFPVHRPELKHQLFLGPEPECFWIGAHTTASPGALAHPRQRWGLLSLHICVKSIMNIYIWASLGSATKNPLPVQEMQVWSLGWEESPGEGSGNPFQCFSHGQRSLAGYSPWGRKRVRHNLVTKQQIYICVCACVCTYMYIYYTYLYTHIYIHKEIYSLPLYLFTHKHTYIVNSFHLTCTTYRLSIWLFG